MTLIDLIKEWSEGAAVAALVGVYHGWRKWRHHRKHKTLLRNTKDNETAQKFLDDLRFKIHADYVLFYLLHNGSQTPSGYHLEKCTLWLDSSDRSRFKTLVGKHEAVPTSTMPQFMRKYLANEVFICEDVKQEQDANTVYMLETMNIKSTYSIGVRDRNGILIGVLCLNYLTFAKQLTDFEPLEMTAETLGTIYTP